MMSHAPEHHRMHIPDDMLQERAKKLIDWDRVRSEVGE